jgi:hypothetical protein
VQGYRISRPSTVVRDWIHERMPQPTDPVFSTRGGAPLSRDAVADLLAKHAARAARACPSLRHKRISPHGLRHTTAMQLLLAGVDRTVIALWLGHESVETTQVYLDANLPLKEAALAKTTPIHAPVPRRFRADDALLTFLNGLWNGLGLCGATVPASAKSRRLIALARRHPAYSGTRDNVPIPAAQFGQGSRARPGRRPPRTVRRMSEHPPPPCPFPPSRGSKMGQFPREGWGQRRFASP